MNKLAAMCKGGCGWLSWPYETCNKCAVRLRGVLDEHNERSSFRQQAVCGPVNVDADGREVPCE
jgi:hypothetical protein